jgi:hypothetical protein
MSQVNNLTPTSSSQITAGTLFPVYVANQTDLRKLPLGDLVTYLQQNFTRGDFVKQIVTPGDGFNLEVEQDGQPRWVILRPTGALATGTIVLPSTSVASDGQEVLVTCTLQITSFTVNGNGATAVYGAPSALSAEDTFKLKYESQTKSWYNVT